MNKERLHCFTGCILGGAVGDAMGAPVEYDSIRAIYNSCGTLGVTCYFEHSNNIGEITDDTQLTLFTAEALINSTKTDNPKQVTDRDYVEFIRDSYRRWYHTQVTAFNDDLNFPDKSGWLINQKQMYKRRSPDHACLISLRANILGTIESPINDNRGNAALIRVVPVGLFFNFDLTLAFRIGVESAVLTHGHPNSYLSAGYFSALIACLSKGAKLQVAIENVLTELKGWQRANDVVTAINNALALYQETKNEEPLELQKNMPSYLGKIGDGRTADQALAMSLFISLHHTLDYKSGVLAAVNQSGDSDSVGSLTGNILGLINGKPGIPKEWIKNLNSNDLIERLAVELWNAHLLLQ